MKKIILPNGLRIILVPDLHTKAVTAMVLVGAGSKYENKENNGISHFLEHMCFKGTTKRPTFLEVNSVIDNIGGQLSAFTTQEYTGYWAKANTQYLELMLDWLADIYSSSTFPEAEIEKEKGVILEEINMYNDQPSLDVFNFWLRLLYGDQPAGWKVSGEKEVVGRIQRQDFFDYRLKHYTAANTLICLAGNFKAEEALKTIEKYFQKINNLEPQDKNKVVEKQTGSHALLHFKQTDQTHFCCGARGYHLTHPYYYSQEIISTILGGNMSSRLFISLREKNGLAYYIHTYADSLTDHGYVVTHAGVNSQQVEKSLGLVIRDYQDLKNKKIDAQELRRAKDFLKGRMALSLEKSENLASFYAYQELLTGKMISPEEEAAKIENVTVQDIWETANDLFQPDKLNLAMIGPFKDNSPYLKILEKGL